MAVLGLVVTASVWSGPAKVQEGNYEANDMDMQVWPSSFGFADFLPLVQHTSGEALEGGRNEANPDNPAASVPSLVASQGQAPLAARLGLVGGRDELLPNMRQPNLGLPGVWTLQFRQTQDLPQMRNEEAEALDAASDTFARGLGASAVLVRLALDSFDADSDDTVSMAGLSGDRVEAEQGIQELPQAPPQDAALGRAAGEVIDDATNHSRGAPTHQEGAGELWLISHYTAGLNWGGTSYPFGSATATGIPAQPGVVACGPSYVRKHVVIAGWEMVCADTGNPAYVYDGVADIWCEEAPGSWGPTDPQYAGEWWYGLPCPAPCEWQNEAGRCFAKARVVR